MSLIFFVNNFQPIYLDLYYLDLIFYSKANLIFNIYTIFIINITLLEYLNSQMWIYLKYCGKVIDLFLAQTSIPVYIKSTSLGDKVSGLRIILSLIYEGFNNIKYTNEVHNERLKNFYPHP